MKGFWVALRKEWLEQWRAYRLLVVGVVFVVFGLLSPLLAKYTPDLIRLLPNGDALAALLPPVTAMDAVIQYLKNISQFGVLLAVLLTMGTVVQEKDKGIAALMLVKPLPRWAFLAAKFKALSLTFMLSLLLAGAACYYYTWLMFDALNLWGWLALNALLLLFILVHVATTLLCSVAGRSQAVAGGLAFGLMILLMLGGTVPVVGQYLPGQLIAWAGGMMAGDAASFWPAVGVSVGIMAISFLGAWRIFQRQEL